MLKKSRTYTAAQLAEDSYLIPFGQGSADQDRTFRLNAAALFLWETAESCQTKEELFRRYAEHEHIPPSERRCAWKDFSDWFGSMLQKGLLKDTEDSCSFPQPDSSVSTGSSPACRLEIAGIRITISGDLQLLPRDLEPFRINAHHRQSVIRPSAGAQTLTLATSPPGAHPGAVIILENSQLEILRSENCWLVRYPAFRFIREAQITINGSAGILYCSPPEPDCLEQEKTELFHALRILFLLYAQQKGFFAIHSSSVCYRGKAWLFAASSGTGKSTHTRFWENAGWGRVLNGDLNLIGQPKSAGEDTDPSGLSETDVRRSETEKTHTPFLTFGIPWCGTSGIFTAETVPLGGIILLHRGETDALSPLTPGEKQLGIIQRMISPAWTEEMLRTHIAFSKKTMENLPVWDLRATPRPSSAALIRSAIDRALDT